MNRVAVDGIKEEFNPAAVVDLEHTFLLRGMQFKCSNGDDLLGTWNNLERGMVRKFCFQTSENG